MKTEDLSVGITGFIDILGFGEKVRIPVQSCHPFQTNAATHSILKLPLIPVNVATLWW